VVRLGIRLVQFDLRTNYVLKFWTPKLTQMPPVLEAGRLGECPECPVEPVALILAQKKIIATKNQVQVVHLL
jgi:hypothetical protein